MITLSKPKIQDGFFEDKLTHKIADWRTSDLSDYRIRIELEKAFDSDYLYIKRLSERDEDKDYKLFGEMKTRQVIRVNPDQPMQSMRDRDNWQKDQSLKHYIWDKTEGHGRSKMAGDKNIVVRTEDYKLNEEQVLQSYDEVKIDGTKYDFLGYYEKKDTMYFRRAFRDSGLYPDKTLSREEFEEKRSEGNAERASEEDTTEKSDTVRELRAAMLPDWIEDRYQFVKRLFDGRDLESEPFIGFDEERRAALLTIEKSVLFRETTNKDVLRDHENNKREDFAYSGKGTEQMIRELINEDWDWIHPKFRWLLKSPVDMKSTNGDDE